MDKCFKINAVLSVFCKRYMDLKKNLPIRPSEMGVLNIITEAETPHTPVMLAEKLSVSKPMITAHITSLKNQGYITKQPSLEDGRVYYIQPTPKAKLLVEKVKKDMDKKLERLANEMGEEKFDSFVKMAEEVACILEEKK